MDQKHTPGPWSACGDGECSCKTVTCGDFPIARITHGDWGDEYHSMRPVGGSIEGKFESYMERIVYGHVSEPVARANASLIAAAPIGLILAREVVREFENLEDRAPVSDDCFECTSGYLPHKRTCAYHLAREFIAKAEGRS